MVFHCCYCSCCHTICTKSQSLVAAISKLHVGLHTQTGESGKGWQLLSQFVGVRTDTHSFHIIQLPGNTLPCHRHQVFIIIATIVLVPMDDE